MRLGIRRKLIGTLMLVGLFPLAMSLVVILAGGAAMQLTRIRNSYEDIAAACSKNISIKLLDVELDRLAFIANAPRTIAFLRMHQRPGTVGGVPTTMPTAEDNKLDEQWKQFGPEDQPLKGILENEASQRLRDLTANDNRPRQSFITNASGEVVAADVKTDDFFQADEKWWQEACNGGRGKLYVSPVLRRTADGDGEVDIAMPVFDTADGKHVFLGVIKDKVGVKWLFDALASETVSTRAQAQLADLDEGKTVYVPEGAQSPANLTGAEKFFFDHRGNLHESIWTLLVHNMALGASPVEFNSKLVERFEAAQFPHWAVIVSKPSQEAMTPVYRLALMVTGIGIALILVLFILGVAISNREIIMPILRLREATAAVGRGELNVRLLSTDSSDKTFRKDELGELARDFDEMTRQLQRNVNQLARSNEAKRRFMELAGHELRTPVTYLLGVCQLAQRQVQALAAAATDGQPETAEAIATAEKNAAVTQGALLKVTAKTQRLSKIIDNLLKLVNNDQFTTRLNKTPVDVRALLLQVTSDHRPFMLERNQTLITDIAENLPSIEADRDKLEDAISNLLSNAIRFSPDGGTVRVAAHEVVGEMLEILVEDSGPGIPQGDLANLFEPFYTGSDILHHHSGTFEFGSKGIGLGLAIVRRFIELHAGIVRAHAVIRDNSASGKPPGTGTQFQILLPLNKDGEGNGTGGAST